MCDQEKILDELRPWLRHVFFNEFLALKRLFKTRNDSFNHLMGLTLLRTGMAAITLDKSKFKLAMDTAWTAIQKSHEMRKASGIFFRCDPNDLTDDECHAELVHSEMLAIYGGLCVVEDQSLMGFVKGALRVRSCYSGLKECERIMTGKSNWRSEVLRQEFSAGVLMDLGLFEMGISFMPRKFMILLELAGFSSNRSFGLDKLESAAKYTLSIRKLGAMLALTGYHMFGEYFYGLGEVKRDLVLNCLTFASELFPTSPYAGLIRGLIDNVTGDFQSALRHYDTITQQPSTPRGMVYVLLYLQAWLNAMECNWQEAMHNSRILKDECKWSRSLFAFMFAIFASQVLKDRPDPQLRESMIDALTAVPRVKRHFGGKKAFHEKIVIEKAAVYLKKPERIILPQLDLMYLWNLFVQASHNPPSLDKIKRMIERELDSVTQDEDPDLFLYLTLCAAARTPLLLTTPLPLIPFLRVIASRDSILEDKHLVPQACFELGMVYRRAGDVDESKKWFRKAKKHSGYLTETMISFRADCALKTYDDSSKRDLN